MANESRCEGQLGAKEGERRPKTREIERSDSHEKGTEDGVREGKDVINGKCKSKENSRGNTRHKNEGKGRTHMINGTNNYKTGRTTD